MLYAADIFLPPVPVDPNRMEARRRRGGQAILSKMASIQRKAAISITGAMNTTAGDVAEAHAGLIPISLYVSMAQHRAALRLATLPPTHPLSKVVKNARARRIKKHPTRIHDLIWTFDLDPSRIEKIEATRYDIGSKAAMEMGICNTGEEAIRRARMDRAEIKVYTDGSGIGGAVGAAAVLERRGRGEIKVRRFKVGAASQNEVYEGELTGLVLGMEMVRAERRVTEVSIYTDNQAAITALTTDSPGPARHIVDMVHERHRMLMTRHGAARVTVHWIPGHSGVRGNERADINAKRAARGDSSPTKTLPACLRKALPVSKTAIRRQYNKRSMEEATRQWRASPRSTRVSRIDAAFSLSRFRKLVSDLPKSQISTLVRLRTGHIALNQHLHRIGKADTPVCPCCQRADETVHHFLLHCPAHAAARRALNDAMGRDSANLRKLLSTPDALTHLFTFIGATGRFAKAGIG